MDEQETTEEKKPEATTETEDAGSKYETTPIIERAREEREKLEAATKAQREENDRTERIMAKRALGGMTEAGQTVKKEVETPEQYADRISKGEANPLKDDGFI